MFLCFEKINNKNVSPGKFSYPLSLYLKEMLPCICAI